MSEEENANPTSSPDDAPPRKFKPAERIEELNDIDKVPCIPVRCPSMY